MTEMTVTVRRIATCLAVVSFGLGQSMTNRTAFADLMVGSIG